MAKAVAECKCRKCGATFFKEAIRGNRADADNWETWAAQHYDLCPDCYKAEKAEKEAEKYAVLVSKYNFPTIEGVSEKQIAYADKLRCKFVVANEADMDEAVNFWNSVDWSEIAKIAEQEGKSVEQITRESVDRLYLGTLACLKCQNAEKLIDMLK